LLACPFCGGDGEIVVDYVLGPNEPLYAPMCEHYADWWENRFVKKYPNGPICQGSAGTNFHTKEEAIAAWNRRTQPATGQQGQWEPLEPGVHTHAKGSAIVDEDGTFVLTHTMSMAQMFGDEKFVEESPFRLCRLTKPPQSTT
jgi:hypothetical protein